MLLTVAYDGTGFHGWQAQQGLRCVQSELAKGAERVAQHPVSIFGASRTDARVHAEGQAASFSTTRELNPRRWAQALNRYLPDDVAVTAVAPCPPDYQPRFDARDKLYRYVFHLGPIRDPLLRHRAWHLGKQLRRDYPNREDLAGATHRLDLGAMGAAAQRFVGTHDFCAFRAASDTRTDTVRTMRSVRLLETFHGRSDLLALEVEGTAFMKNTVRIMAGTLIAVGRGRMAPQDVSTLLQPGQSREHPGETAPPEGLTLLRVRLGRGGLATTSAPG